MKLLKLFKNLALFESGVSFGFLGSTIALMQGYGFYGFEVWRFPLVYLNAGILGLIIFILLNKKDDKASK